MTKKEILQDLRNRILEEEYVQGQSLVERDLCNKYGISRTPIREVLWSLVVDGIIEQRPSKGFYVRKLERNQIFEIFQAREGIEGIASRIACKRADPNQISKIIELYEQLIKLDVEKNSKEGAHIGRLMHKQIIDAEANSLLSEIYEKLQYLAHLTSNIARQSVVTESDSKKYHLAIMQAIIHGDPDKSEYFMREHLQVTCKNIIEMLYPQVFYTLNDSMTINNKNANTLNIDIKET